MSLHLIRIYGTLSFFLKEGTLSYISFV